MTKCQTLVLITSVFRRDLFVKSSHVVEHIEMTVKQLVKKEHIRVTSQSLFYMYPFKHVPFM